MKKHYLIGLSVRTKAGVHVGSEWFESDTGIPCCSYIESQLKELRAGVINYSIISITGFTEQEKIDFLK
jgi:hypothetical protein